MIAAKWLFLDLATRRVRIAGTTTNPTSEWRKQVACNVTICETGFLRRKRYLIVDRNSVSSPRIRSTLEGADVEVSVTAYQAPNLNAHVERFVRSIRSGCLDRTIFVGRSSPEGAVGEHVVHDH